MLTKQEILARKNAMKAAGKNITIDESWGPQLEKMWQSFAPNTYLTSEIKNTDGQNNQAVTVQKPTNNAKWYNPLTWLGGISYALTKDMGREEK